MMITDFDRLVAALLFVLLSMRVIEADPALGLLGILAAAYSAASAFDYIDPTGV